MRHPNADTRDLGTARTRGRLDRLERRQRGLLAVLGALVAVFAFTSARGDGDVLRVRRVEIVDGEGRVRAELAIDADGSAGVFLKDDQGRLRGCFVHDASQTGMFALDDGGQIRVGAAQFAHGGGGFALHGPEGKGSAVLYLKGDGSLTFFDADGGVRRRIPEDGD